MNEGQLMGDFELDSKQLEAESWSQVVDSKFLRQQKKDVVKRQDVIYGETCSHYKRLCLTAGTFCFGTAILALFFFSVQE